MTEIVFIVEDDPDGGYTAVALTESIFTQRMFEKSSCRYQKF
ncbi:MAG: hypothetical protein V7K27_33260 [Nostoc sp.]